MSRSATLSDDQSRIADCLIKGFSGRYVALEASSSQCAVVHDTNSGQQAIAFLETHQSRGSRLRSENDIAILRQLDSPFVPALIDWAVDDERTVVITQHVGGVPLSCDESSRSIVESLRIGAALFSALDSIHRLGSWHGDVRPDNVVIPGDKSVPAILTNFGRSRSTDVGALTMDQLLSRAWYLSPEQAGSTDRDVRHTADIYSAGAILFSLLAGKPPFPRSNLSEVLLAHVTAHVPTLRELGVEAPRVVDELVHRLLRKDPTDRYQSAKAVAEELREIADEVFRGNKDPRIVVGGRDERQTLTEPAFVARSDERRSIIDRLDDANSGNPALVLLEGESGLGKTRLLTEIAQHAAAAQFQIFRGQGKNSVSRHSLSVLDGIVEAFLAAGRSDPTIFSRLRNNFDADCNSLVSALPDLAEVFDDGSKEDTGPESFVEQRSLWALSAFLNSLGTAERPALVILDDCQWADDLTYKLLRFWQSDIASAREFTHVLLLVAFRTEEVAERHSLRALNPSTHVRLRSLDSPSVRLLVESMAGQLPNDAVEFLTDVADGSPFMASAALRGLVESGALVYGNGKWQTDDVAMQRCQSSTQSADLLATRLNLLPDSAIQLLSAGAVLGKEFDWSAAVWLTGQTTSEAIDCLAEARLRHLIWGRANGLRFAFVHDKIRESLLSRLSEQDRRRAHVRAAEYLLASESPKAVEVAFHFDQAADHARALPFAIAAAEQARKQHSLEVAQQQYEIALRAANIADIAQRYRIVAGLGDVLMLRGEYNAAEDMFNEGWELTESNLHQAQIGGKLAELAHKRGDIERAIQDYEKALQLLGNYVPKKAWVLGILVVSESVRQLFHTVFPKLLVHRLKRMPNEAERLSLRLISGLSHAYYYGRSKSYVLWAHFRALNLAESYSSTVELANVYSEHAPAMALVTLFGRAFRYADKSTEIHKSFGNLWGQGQALWHHGCALYAASRFEECISKCREAVRLLERTGDYWQLHIARFQIAASYYHLGDFRSAMEEAKKNHESGLKLGDELASGINLEIWARCTGGKIPEDQLKIEVARDRFETQGKCQVMLAHAVFQLGENNADEAIDILEQAIRAAKEAGISNCYSLPILAWHVTALRQKVENDRSITPCQRNKALKKAVSSARRAMRGSRISKNDVPRILREWALVESMQGHEATARKLFDRSIGAARKLGERHELVLGLAAKARVGAEYRWPDAARLRAEAEMTHNELVAAKYTLEFAETDDEAATLSLADRFDGVLQSGRSITTAVTEMQVFQRSREAALRLLRGNQGVIARVESDGTISPLVGNTECELDLDFVRQAIVANSAVSGVRVVTGPDAVGESMEVSIVAAPIMVRGTTKACIYVTNQQVRGLFGRVEERLLEFIVAIAGASIESAEGYEQLRSLNETLEERVAERTAAAESRARQLSASNENLERVAAELRETEEQLRIAMATAQAANQAKSDFLATMSHEIRTPMNGILGMTELAMNTSLTPQQENCLNVVKSSGDALMNLLNDVLDLSKIEAGRMDLEQIEFDLRDVAEGAVRLFSKAAHDKGLEIVCHMKQYTQNFVCGDPNRIRQVLSNLIGNAVKFTHKGEVVLRIAPGTDQDGRDLVHFEVSDTGIGIPPEKQSIVFEAFRQSDSSTTRRFGGTGLGLAISGTLVELMHGRFWLESEVNQGSKFHFEIPLPKVADQGFPDNKTTRVSATCVCLISTHDSGRIAYEEVLKCMGLAVVCVEDFEGLCDINDTCDLVVIDQPIGANLQVKSDSLDCPYIILAGPSDAVDESLPRVYKPVTQHDLVRATFKALGRDSEFERESEQDLSEGIGRLRILLADDSFANQAVAAGLLELQGHNVDTVGNGQEACDAMGQGSFDLILMDLEMPVMDGLEATARIRDDEVEQRKRRTPIIAMTAHAIPDAQAKCMNGGMDGYISKPIDTEEMFHTIADVVRAHREYTTVF